MYVPCLRVKLSSKGNGHVLLWRLTVAFECDVLADNLVSKILQTRQGRCGEYAQALYQLIYALGWRTRLVVDWTDHLWVEALLPVSPSSNGASTPRFRWVHFDPCEAAVDMPKLYADWGKNHTYIIGIGDGRIADLTAAYARDFNATLHRRDLPPGEVARALSWTRLVCKLPR